MATNLISLVMQYLTPDMIGRIAAALGLDRGNTQTAIGAAVPALLAGLSNVVAQPGGAQKVADAAKQQTGTLDNLSSMIGGSSQAGLADTGSRILSSLLGGQQNALAGAVANFAGLGQDKSSSLLGMLAPIVIGAIAKQQGGRGIDAGSVANLLAAQKEHIATAMPSAFRNQLENTGLLDALGGVAGMATAAAGQPARAATYATQTVTDTGSRAPRAGSAAASTSLNWLYWALPAVAAVALLFYVFARPAEQATQQTTQQAVNSTQSVTVGGVDLGRQVGDTLASLRTSLQDIKDPASATAILPRLQEVTTQIDNVNGSVKRLSPEQRKVIAGLVSPKMPTLNQMFDKVLAIPGVAAVLKPTVDALKEDLAKLDSSS